MVDVATHVVPHIGLLPSRLTANATHQGLLAPTGLRVEFRSLVEKLFKSALAILIRVGHTIEPLSLRGRCCAFLGSLRRVAHIIGLAGGHLARVFHSCSNHGEHGQLEGRPWVYLLIAFYFQRL